MGGRDEIRFRIPRGPDEMKHAAIIMGELQRRAQAAEPKEVDPGPEHVIIEHQEMWRCMGTREYDGERCVLVEHEGNMHMRWDGGRAEYWVDA